VNWLSVTPWLIALAGILGGGAYGVVERMNYLGEKAARAEDLDHARQAALKAKADDATKTKQLEDEHATEVAKLKEKANARDVAIAQVPVTVDCVASPAMRALFDGLRTRSATAGAGQSGPAGRIDPLLP
jgi:hypothetical protein